MNEIIVPNHPEIGKRYNRWTILEVFKYNKEKGTLARLLCDCGNQKIRSLKTIRNQNSKSCGSCESIESIGLRFGHLVVLRFQKQNLSKGIIGGVFCICDCGKEVKTTIGALNKKKEFPRSCGCMRKVYSKKYDICLKSDKYDISGASIRGHKFYKEHRCWGSMKYRCLSESCKDYKDYGGRGISVYPEWISSFVSFIEHIGPMPGKGYTIDRIDNMKGYIPGNVAWTTRKEQANNRREFKPHKDIRGLRVKCKCCEEMIYVRPCKIGIKKYCSSKCYVKDRYYNN